MRKQFGMHTRSASCVIICTSLNRVSEASHLHSHRSSCFVVTTASRCCRAQKIFGEGRHQQAFQAALKSDQSVLLLVSIAATDDEIHFFHTVVTNNASTYEISCYCTLFTPFQSECPLLLLELMIMCWYCLST